MKIKFFNRSIICFWIMICFNFVSLACDGLVVSVISNVNLGNGTYQLTIRVCEEISNGGTTEVSGFLLDVVGANVLSTSTPSFTSSSTGVTINYNVIDANTVQWGEWDDNPNVPPFMDDGDPEQCLILVVITDGPATSIGLAGSSANVDEGSGFTTHMGRRTCRDVVTVPAPCTPVTPTFNPIANRCQNSGSVSLPTTSTNGIVGTWSPSSISTTTTGTKTATFTPSGGCAPQTTITVTVVAGVVPTFNPIAPVCQNASVTLPTTSTNGLTGTWAPVVNTSAVGTINYTFTTTGATCITSAVLPITVTNSITPTFNPIASVCVGAASPTLATTSTNGITGTWSPATVSTATAGTQTYTFTPNPGQCAINTTLNVTITSGITPTFNAQPAVCVGSAAPVFPTTSTNGITGTWAPAISTATAGTTSYTFTPNPGQCATTATSSLTVSSSITPTFTQVAPICSGGSFTLPTTSTNGINGTWAPAINNTATTLYTFTPTAGQCATTTTMTVSVNSQTTPTFTQVAPICSGGSFTLPTTSNNGINGTWTPAINNTATTLYTFTPTAGQCATTTTMTVNVGAQTTPTFTQVAPICIGGSFTLPTTSNNGFNGTWAPAINNTTTTLYTFTPTAGQCASTTTMSVTVNPQTAPTFTQVAPICSGGSFTLPTTSTNGINGTWSPAINNTTTTLYTFTPTAGQCAATTTMSVTVNPQITPTFTQVAPICSGGSITLPTTSNDGYTGTWSPAINNTATTLYTFTPDPGQCATTTTMSVTVNPQITPIFTQVAPICAGESFTLLTTSNNGYTGTWSPAIDNMATTLYTFTPDPGQCATTTTMSVTVNPLPVVNAGVDQSICIGASATLTASGATTYVWNNGGGNGQSVSPSATTTYTVIGNVGNCSNSDDITITVNPLPQVAFTPDVATGCEPLDVTFTVQSPAGVSCVWNFGDGSTDTGCGSISHTYTGSGCFDVRMTTTDANGCVNSQMYSNLICLVAYPIAEFGVNPSIITTTYPVSNMLNESQGAVSYFWDFGDESATSTATDPTHTFPFGEGATYTIMLIADNGYGCTDTAYQTIKVEEDIIFYVPNTFTPDGDSYNQNFKPIFTSGFDPFDYTLWIYNRWGEIVFESHNALIGWDGKYAGAYDVQDGTYTWKIEFKQSMNDKRRTEMGHVTIIR